MGRVVVLEVWTSEGEWHRIGTVSEVDQPGSMSRQGPNGREVYLFGWLDGAGPCLWRSKFGVDAEVGQVRAITTLGLDVIADLTQEPHIIDKMGPSGRARVRFRAAD